MKITYKIKKDELKELSDLVAKTGERVKIERYCEDYLFVSLKPVEQKLTILISELEHLQNLCKEKNLTITKTLDLQDGCLEVFLKND